MNKLRQSLRRRKPAYVPEASRPHQWQADEDAVRKGTCSFPVRVSGRGSAGRGCSCSPAVAVLMRSSVLEVTETSACVEETTSAKNCGA